MSEGSSGASSGVSFLGLLAILFIGLKLGGVIDWSWLWVLSPLWLGLAVIVAVFVVAALVIILIGLVRYLFRKRE